jgi:hypothetical protein
MSAASDRFIISARYRAAVSHRRQAAGILRSAGTELDNVLNPGTVLTAI